jgi:signal peptidase II
MDTVVPMLPEKPTVQAAKWIRFAVPGVLALIVDQVTKQWARAALSPEGSGRMRSIIGKALTLHYAENPGIAFSMFRELRGGRFVLAGLSIVALVMVLRYLHGTDAGQRRLHVALGLIAGGALGNLLDRMIYSRVVDFIVVDLGVWPANPWPVFNVADMVLVAGVGLIALDVFRTRRAADGLPSTPAG